MRRRWERRGGGGGRSHWAARPREPGGAAGATGRRDRRAPWPSSSPMGDMSDGAPWSRGEDGVAAGRSWPGGHEGGARREVAADRERGRSSPGGRGRPGAGEEVAGRPRPAGHGGGARREATASRVCWRSSPGGCGRLGAKEKLTGMRRAPPRGRIGLRACGCEKERGGRKKIRKNGADEWAPPFVLF